MPPVTHIDSRGLYDLIFNQPKYRTPTPLCQSSIYPYGPPPLECREMVVTEDSHEVTCHFCRLGLAAYVEGQIRTPV